MAFSSDRTSSACVYRVVVRGRLTDRFAASFDGMTIEPGETTSVLSGTLRDQSHLMGILRAIDALGIELVSVAPDTRVAERDRGETPSRAGRDADLLPETTATESRPRLDPDPGASIDLLVADALAAPSDPPTERAFMSRVRALSRFPHPRPLPLGAVVAFFFMACACLVAAAPAFAANSAVPEAGVCSTCKPPLAYQGGSVMGTASTPGAITITAIYWTPAGYSFANDDPTYVGLVNRYITDIAKASNPLATNNVYAILPEYSSTTGAVTTNLQYSITAGTPIVATDPLPAAAAQCTPTPGWNYTACVTKAQTQAEMKTVLAANSLPADLAHLYVLMLPPNVQTTVPNGGSVAYSCVLFNGVHSAFTTAAGGTVVYATEPYAQSNAAGTQQCLAATPTPNQDVQSDGEIGTLSHEINESVTDPLGESASTSAWKDSAGQENGDECNSQFGTPLGGTDTVDGPDWVAYTGYNQVINGHFYETQTEFSNAAYKANGIGKGCVGTAYVAKSSAAFARSLASPADVAGSPYTMTVDASPSNLPADGASTSTITATVLDANGDPVPGDYIKFGTQDDIKTPGVCGTLSGSDGLAPPGTNPKADQPTNASGQVTVTYTASTSSAKCYVLATELTQGSTDQTIIYQGTDEADSPSVTETLPASLAAGGPMSTFTATATNPTANGDIADGRFDLYITGDTNGATGINANQLTLNYKDDATGGDFVNVPLTGSTANGGTIEGFVIPDTAENLGAGATRTATFQLSLAAGAPDSTTTGSPLAIESDFDVFNPADGSQSNLGRTSPAPVPVVQAPGDTITYSGKMSTTVAPTATTNGSGVLVGKTCKFASDGATCRLTGTLVLTLTGGTLTGFVSTDDATGSADRTVSFTENFTYSSPTAASGTGTAEVDYFDNGNSVQENLTGSDTTAKTTTVPNVVTETGTIVLTNPAP